jgi:hypothetical protein
MAYEKENECLIKIIDGFDDYGCSERACIFWNGIGCDVNTSMEILRGVFGFIKQNPVAIEDINNAEEQEYD